MNSENRKKNPSLLSRLRSAALAQDMPYSRILRAMAICLAAAIVAGASLFGIARPFGLSLIAAAGGFTMTIAAAAGNVIGSLGRGDFAAGTAASVLLCTLVSLILSWPGPV